MSENIVSLNRNAYHRVSIAASKPCTLLISTRDVGVTNIDTRGKLILPANSRVSVAEAANEFRLHGLCSTGSGILSIEIEARDYTSFQIVPE